MFVELRHASRTLPGGQRVLNGVELSIDQGEIVAIVGRSGSGKSTLLAGMGLLAPFDKGTDYTIAGRGVHAMRGGEANRFRNEQIGFILQNSGLIDHLTSLQNVMTPFMHRNAGTIREARRKAEGALERVGLEALKGRRPARLSGGERQRVAIARAIVVEPALILADEPTGALDNATATQVFEEILGLVRTQRSALVVVTHDREVAARADRAYSLEDGMLRELSVSELS